MLILCITQIWIWCEGPIIHIYKRVLYFQGYGITTLFAISENENHILNILNLQPNILP